MTDVVEIRAQIDSDGKTLRIFAQEGSGCCRVKAITFEGMDERHAVMLFAICDLLNQFREPIFAKFREPIFAKFRETIPAIGDDSAERRKQA